MQNGGSIILYRSRTEMELDKLLWSGDSSVFEFLVFLFIAVPIFVFVFSKLQRLFRSDLVVWLISVPTALTGSYIVCKLLAWLILFL
jgi:hypothetical protein